MRTWAHHFFLSFLVLFFYLPENEYPPRVVVRLIKSTCEVASMWLANRSLVNCRMGMLMKAIGGGSGDFISTDRIVIHKSNKNFG